MNADPKKVIAWVLALCVPVAATLILAGFITFIPLETLISITEEHFPAVVGLPLAALLAAFIVVALEQTSGPMKFEGLGFKFDGSAGQVILWVFCFLAIAAAIRLLWTV